MIVVKLQPQPHSPFFCLPYVKYILIKVIGNNLTKSSLWLHYSDDVHIIIYKICLIHLYIYSVKRPEKKKEFCNFGRDWLVKLSSFKGLSKSIVVDIRSVTP